MYNSYERVMTHRLRTIDLESWLAEIGERVGIRMEEVESCLQRIQSFRQRLSICWTAEWQHRARPSEQVKVNLQCCILKRAGEPLGKINMY